MKIVDKRDNIITFAELKTGDVFCLKDFRDYYMKTEPMLKPLGDSDYEDDKVYNAVFLRAGTESSFALCTEVILVAHELIVK